MDEGEATTPSSSRLLASSITQCILKTSRYLEKIGSMGCIRGQFPNLKYHLGSQTRPAFLTVTSFNKCRLVHCFPRHHTYLGIWPLNNLVFSEEQAQLTLHHMSKKQGTHHVVLWDRSHCQNEYNHSFLQSRCTSRCKESRHTNTLRGLGKTGGRVRGHIFIGEGETCIASSVPVWVSFFWLARLSFPKNFMAMRWPSSNKHQKKSVTFSQSVQMKSMRNWVWMSKQASKDRSSYSFDFTGTAKNNFQQKEFPVTSRKLKYF